MSEQGPEHYVKQLQVLKELEKSQLIRAEVAIKWQDILLARMFREKTDHDESNHTGEVLALSEEIYQLSSHQSSSRNHLFISYSHADKKWFDRFYEIFKPLLSQQKIHIWDHTQIRAGTDWQVETERALTTTKVALLLVTPAFLASDFILRHELTPLLNAAKSEGLKIMWIDISPCLYQQTEIAMYQSLNPSKPLASFKGARLDEELTRICWSILEEVKEEVAVQNEKTLSFGL